MPRKKGKKEANRTFSQITSKEILNQKPLPSQVDDDYTKEVYFQPSTIETIDTSMMNYLNNLKLNTVTQSGFKEVPVVWTSPERSQSSKKDHRFRDDSGALILPIISVERTSMVKDPTKKGSVQANIMPVKDERGGSIKIARRIKQDKTSNFANKDSLYNNGQLNFPTPTNKKVVYETITIPLPVYVSVTYKITFRTEFQQQMNHLVTPFITRPGAVNYILLNSDEGHRYEAFIQQDFSQDNNYSSFTSEERKLETSLNINVLGYLIGDDVNQIKPKMVIRENAVEFKMSKERIALQDEVDHANGKLYGL